MIIPINEQGVVVLFQEISKSLGFEIVSIQTGFPDAIIKDTVGNEYRAEFEYYSGNFIKHKHEPIGCDVIICWEHNLHNPPLPVISLKYYLEMENKRKEVRTNRFTNAIGFWSGMATLSATCFLLANNPFTGAMEKLVDWTSVFYTFYVFIMIWDTRSKTKS